MYKTLEDLKLITEKKSLNALLDFTKSYLEGQKVQEFIKGSEDKEIKSLKEQYQELYPDTKIEEYDRFGNTLTREIQIEYIEYSEEKEVIDSLGNVKLEPVLPELTDKQKEKLEKEELQIRPTYEFFESKKLEEFIKTLDITEEEIKEIAKPYFIEMITRLADETHEKAEAMIADVNQISEKQIQRYKIKADLAQKAKDGDVDAKARLQIEAKLVGVDIDTLIKLILDLADQYNLKIDNYISLIEAFRVAVKSKYDEDFTSAIEIAKQAKKLGAETTPEKLQELFSKYFK